LDPAVKVLDDPPAFFPWDRSYCCCDCCLPVRDSLEVVAIHPVLKVSPHIKIWGVQVRCDVWGVAASCWNHWRTLKIPLRRPSAVQNLSNTWTYRSVLIVTDCSLSSSNQNGPMIPCLEMATQAVHFAECNVLCRQCSGGVLPQKMLFLEFT